jgi:hypothetical protein
MFVIQSRTAVCVRTAFTNNMTAGATRSFGIVKLAFATKSQVNKLAQAA